MHFERRSDYVFVFRNGQLPDLEYKDSEPESYAQAMLYTIYKQGSPACLGMYFLKPVEKGGTFRLALNQSSNLVVIAILYGHALSHQTRIYPESTLRTNELSRAG